jgi:citrate lyase subunit beta/citryl-CoA lyase
LRVVVLAELAPPRTALYVPGHRRDKLDGALGRGADALIVDLEDAVPPDHKDVARVVVAEWLATLVPGRQQVWVRVNPGARRYADLAALADRAAVTGFCLAKVEGADELDEVDAQLTAAGSRAALAPVLETAAAVLDARAIAAGPRVHRLQIGEADLCAELGLRPGPDRIELLGIRTMVVLAAAAAGIASPLGPVSTDVRDLGALETSTLALQRLGFFGRACIHPAQLATVNAVFTPSAEEGAAAIDLVARFDAGGGGAVMTDDGAMIDEAVVRRLRPLAAAAAAAARDTPAT